MRSHALALAIAMAAALLVAGCSAAMPPATAAPGGHEESRQTAASLRCADTDPDRFAWFCVLGRALYNTAAGLQSENIRRR